MKCTVSYRLLLFASLFLAVIIFDLFKFLLAGEPTIVNWEITWPLIVHPIWVLIAATMLFAASFIPSMQRVALFFI